IVTLNNTNSSTGGVSVLMNKGDGTFGAPTHYTVPGARMLTLSDLNGDGRPVLVVGTGIDLSVLLNQGDGTFGAPTNYAVNRHFQSLAVGDLNGDGHPDIVLGNGRSNSVSVLLNNGNGTFRDRVDYAFPFAPDVLSPSPVALADVNGDGNLDSVAGTDNVGVLFGKGAGTFLSRQASFGVGRFPQAVALGDFNGDGHLDLVTANQGSFNPSTNAWDSSVSVALGNGNGT